MKVSPTSDFKHELIKSIFVFLKCLSLMKMIYESDKHFISMDGDRDQERNIDCFSNWRFAFATSESETRTKEGRRRAETICKSKTCFRYIRVRESDEGGIYESDKHFISMDGDRHQGRNIDYF
jgi:hypothetical protein